MRKQPLILHGSSVQDTNQVLHHKTNQVNAKKVPNPSGPEGSLDRCRVSPGKTQELILFQCGQI